ncbi:MAG: putative Na+/H+ antiporter [Betaproteobacteria bacterium]
MQWVGAGLFAIAVLHTFSTKFFEHLAHTRPEHAGVWHLLGEVEVVFGFWAIVLIAFMLLALGFKPATDYLDSRNFTEPMFVFAIMVVAASRPILDLTRGIVTTLARALPLPGLVGYYLLALSAIPLLGSFITEPAAMTLAALMLRDGLYTRNPSNRLKYATLGVLFVNISIGGTLTPFAAPPVLMVAAKWGWDLPFMLSNFGWRAAAAVALNAAAVTVLFYRELARIELSEGSAAGPNPITRDKAGIPPAITIFHILLLSGVVVFAHHPAAFMGLFLLFMGVATAYPQYQDRLILREGLLVAFFLAGLVVLGGQQQWWLETLLRSMSPDTVFWAATALTAITDNAALTYLGSLVEGLSPEFKYALVAGAVTGGGLTVIANAPNPAGFAILKRYFDDEAISAAGLLAAASLPTLVAAIAFKYL